ncbi:MAG TPA: MBL fold metallo-hydrolase [Bryobacteraceae bacterium]|nr:MBL fold metallo-hydrolase [Bryobacteraceae bacterium]
MAGGALAAQSSSSRANTVQITILSTMLSGPFLGEWGFSALLEVDGKRTLFDTGNRPETVLNNLREMKLDLSGVPSVVLTHHHRDHTGGLVTLRRDAMRRDKAALATAYGGKGILLPRNPGNDFVLTKGEYEATGGKLVEVDQPRQLAPSVWLTGPIPRVHNERNWSGSTRLRMTDRMEEDTLPEDQALVIDTNQGLIVVSGCGHAGIVNTLGYARKVVRDTGIYAVVGGFHLFDANEEKLEWTAGQLRPMDIKYFLAAHCTGVESTVRLRELLRLPPERMTIAQVGRRFESGKGITGARS